MRAAEQARRLFAGVREALPKQAPWRALLRAPFISGWVPGRFPHALRGGPFHRQRDYFLYIPVTVGPRDRVPLLVMLHGCHDYVRGKQLLLRSILIDGLGHAWSGGDERLRFNDAAQPDTSRLIWDFLSTFRRPPPRRAPPLRLWLRYLGRQLRG